jgi:hypothetical protein
MFVSLPFPRHPMHRRLDDVRPGPISTWRDGKFGPQYSRSMLAAKKERAGEGAGYSHNLGNAPKTEVTPDLLRLLDNG